MALNKDLEENIQDDKVIISLKTNDFLTFVRIEDEYDEIRKRSNILQQKKYNFPQNV